MDAPTVETTYGKISGRTDSGVHAFLGIPYGASTAGKGRHRPPGRPESWTGTREATALGPTAPQDVVNPNSGVIPSELAAAYGFVPGGRPAIGEDCLVLNVWTSGLDDQRRPVMVWLHGGAFMSGSGSKENGGRLAARGDVVIVTLNHRLNAFGFLHLDELAGGRYQNSGIVGMLDIVAALEWVRDNIASFGGDPFNVTIFGCSGGALKVSTLLAMPAAQGLFHRAIMESGPYLQGVERHVASELAERLLRHLGMTPAGLEKLGEIPLTQLLEAQKNAVTEMPAGFNTGWALWTIGPVVGGSPLPQHPFEPSASPISAGVPLVIGHNANEASMALMVTYPRGDPTPDDVERMATDRYGERGAAILELYHRTRPTAANVDLIDALVATDAMWLDSVRIAERQAASRSAPIFFYRFGYQSDAFGGGFRAGHGLEVPFVFDDVEASVLTGTRPERRELARLMSQAWVKFATDGDPNHTGLPKWAPYSETQRSTMIFDAPCCVEDDPTELRRGLDALDVRFNPGTTA
jgi:para-nitrobenzyl esterase